MTTNQADRGSRRADIAVIGMALRFPGADSPEEFWENLAKGIESISSFTDAELLAAGVYPEFLSDRNYVRAGGFPRNFKAFAPEFFGISGREAELTDPQQRMALECAWEALERAGYDPFRYQGKIGVFAGVAQGDHRNYVLNNLGKFNITERFLAIFGNDNDFLATRISYKLNLRGPSLTIQTACSTSLVATHIASRSLQNMESDIGIAGGVSIDSLDLEGYFYIEGGISSPDGHCRAFDADAQGTVFTNGAGFVVLKRLDDAIRDRDNIYAVIKGSAINNDGSRKVGYFAPSVDGQADVVASAFADAHITADSISYIEAHGTGTQLGDPIEIEALTRVFRKDTEARQICAIGSVKTNIGHLNTAAGVSGLIKTCLALQKRQIPPTIHFRRHNPQIDFESSPFFINSTLIDWTNGTGPRRAGVTALGVGGTNAHVVVEEAPHLDSIPATDWPAYIIPLSAKDPEALVSIQDNLAGHLERNPGTSMADLAFTMQLGRAQFEHRVALISDGNTTKLAEQLRSNQVAVSGLKPETIFVLPGSGMPQVGMARDLYLAQECFRKDLDLCADKFMEHSDVNLLALLYPAEDGSQNPAHLGNPVHAGPILFGVEYALASLFIRWKVRPAALLGYGVGEYVAAVLSGAMDLDTAINLVARRANAIEAMPKGRLIEIPLGSLDLCSCTELVRVYDTDRSVGLSGNRETVEAAIDTLMRLGVPVRLLGDSIVPDEAILKAIKADFAIFLGKSKLGTPSLPVISGWSGRWWSEIGAMDSQYWSDQLANGVKLGHAKDEIRRHFPSADIVQLGPSMWTEEMLARSVAGSPACSQAILNGGASAHAQGACAGVLEVLGRAWVRGAAVDWEAIASTNHGRRIVLPTYPFHRRPIWFEREDNAFPETISEAGPSREANQRGGRREHRNDELRPTDRGGNVAKPAGERVLGVLSPSSINVAVADEAKARFDTKTTVHEVTRLCQQTLKVDAVDQKRSFLECGGDSIRAVQFVWAIEKTFGVKLDVDAVLEMSLMQLAELLESAKMGTASTQEVDSETTELICNLCRKSLKIDAVNSDQSFLECGGDSIRAVQFIWLVEKDLKVRLDVDDVLSLSMKRLADAVDSARSHA